MKKSGAGLWASLAVVLAGGIYSAIVFLAKASMGATEWTLYGFTMAAFLLLAVQVSGTSRSAVVLDTVLQMVTGIYFGVQLALGGILLMCFADLPTAPVFACELALFAVYVALSLAIFAKQSRSAAQSESDRDAVSWNRRMEDTVRALAGDAADPRLRQSLEKLAEAIHYSDPIVRLELAREDEEIARGVACLQDEVSGGGMPLARIEVLLQLVKERDQKAMLLKR